MIEASKDPISSNTWTLSARDLPPAAPPPAKRPRQDATSADVFLSPLPVPGASRQVTTGVPRAPSPSLAAPQPSRLADAPASAAPALFHEPFEAAHIFPLVVPSNHPEFRHGFAPVANPSPAASASPPSATDSPSPTPRTRGTARSLQMQRNRNRAAQQRFRARSKERHAAMEAENASLKLQVSALQTALTAAQQDAQEARFAPVTDHSLQQENTALKDQLFVEKATSSVLRDDVLSMRKATAHMRNAVRLVCGEKNALAEELNAARAELSRARLDRTQR